MMKPIALHRLASARRRRRSALTVTELMVSVAIMSVIVFGLYSLFAHTQKALRGNVNQVDIFETGRATMDMISRELEEMAASGLSNRVNLQAVRSPVKPLAQAELDARFMLRTNVLQEMFFLSRRTNHWTGIGYRVMEPIGGVGTLYRFDATVSHRELPANDLLARFNANTVDAAGRVSTNLNRVAAGVIHFRVRAYDPFGRRLEIGAPIAFTNLSPQVLTPAQRVPVDTARTVFLRPDAVNYPTQTEFVFTSNAIPAYVELELGVLEPETLKQFQSVRDNPNLAGDFLRKRANKVHLFRQRIPIRTAVQ